jgi:hypothetical protein
LHGMMCHSLVLTSRIQFRKANIRSTPLLHLVDQPAPEFDVRLTAMSVTHRDHDELVYCAARGWESEENFLDMDFCFSLQSTKKKQSCGGGVDLWPKPSLGAVAQALLYGRLLDMPCEEVMAAMRRPAILSTIIRHDQARL